LLAYIQWVRWPRLTRRRANEAAHTNLTGAFKPGSWAQPITYMEQAPPAHPAGDVEVIAAPEPPGPPAERTVPLVSPPIHAAIAAAVPSSDAPDLASPPPVSAAEDSSGVRLGFEDGSDLQLAPDHPHSLALKAVADILLHRGSSHRRAG
jgi:hypothetical protein